MNKSDEKRVEMLQAKIAVVGEKKGAALKQIAKTMTAIDRWVERIRDSEERIKSYEAVIADADKKKASAEEKLIKEKGAIARYEVCLSSLRSELQDAQQENTNFGDVIEATKAEIEWLNRTGVVIIHPSYDGELPTDARWLISTYEIDGVECREENSNINSLTYMEVVELKNKVGIADDMQFIAAYEFAWLVKLERESEENVRVLVDDEAVEKLINTILAA